MMGRENPSLVRCNILRSRVKRGIVAQRSNLPVPKLRQRAARIASNSLKRFAGGRNEGRAATAFPLPPLKLHIQFHGNPLTIACRNVLLPASFTRTVSFGWHHLTSVNRDDLNAAQDVVRRATSARNSDRT